LERGELQVTTQERQSQHESLIKDIINIIVEKTVNPDTQRPYPATIIEKAVKDLHYNVSSGKNSKQHAMDVIKLLQEEQSIPISRANMKVRISLPTREGKRLKEKIVLQMLSLESDDYGNSECSFVGIIEPGQFKTLSELLHTETRGAGRIDFLALSQAIEGDERIP
jgi:ribosome maturation protein SDO1